MVKREDRLKTLFEKKDAKPLRRNAGNTASRNAVELHKLTLRLPADLVRSLKHEAVDKKTTLTAIIEKNLRK